MFPGKRRGGRWAVLAAVAAIASACVAPDVSLQPFPVPNGDPVVSVAPPDTVGPLRMVGGRLVDGAGRTVLLHGINSVKKSAPFISLLSDGELGPRDRRFLRTSGLDAVRLGVTYASLMPEPGVVDEDYLARVVEVVDTLTADGLWVQLDFHQDVFFQMPEWATPPDATALSADPPAWAAFIGWAAGYLSPRSIRQWDSFLAGEPIAGGRSVAARLGDAGAALAARVADNDHVIGIELLNEPFAGSATLRCLLEGCSDKNTQLADRYAEMVAPIRVAAPEMPVWEEPFAPTGLLAPNGLPARPVAPTSSGPQVGLAWHLYCNDTDGGVTEEAPGGTAIWCEQRFARGFDNGQAMAKVLGGPALLNEFGASANPLDVTLATREADRRFVSWMYWHHASATTDDDSQLPDLVESQIIRPYPQATAGDPDSLSFDPATGRFEFQWHPDAAATLPTSIVIPRRQYPNGYDVEVRNGSVTSAPDSGRLTVAATGSADVRVRVTRR